MENKRRYILKEENKTKLIERINTDANRENSSKRMTELNLSENNSMKKEKNKIKAAERFSGEANPMKQEKNKIKASERIKGENNPNFKYGEDIINKILELRKDGLTYSEISKKTGVSLAKVGKICKDNK